MSTPGPYNPAAALPQKMVKKILDLEFVEIAELTNDAWQDDLPSEPPRGGWKLVISDARSRN